MNLTEPYLFFDPYTLQNCPLLNNFQQKVIITDESKYINKRYKNIKPVINDQ